MAMTLCLLTHHLSQAAPAPASLQGNWMASDGSNRLVLGIIGEVAVYKNKTWAIVDIQHTENHWHLALALNGGQTGLDFDQEGGNLILPEGREKTVLSTERVYNYKYKLKGEAPRPPVFEREGSAVISGVIRMSYKRKSELPVSGTYENYFTGEKEYVYAERDSLGRFTMRLPIQHAVNCAIVCDGVSVSVMLRPGDSVLMSGNGASEIDGSNPDYGRLSQRVAFMGDNQAFNNEFLHFSTYAAGLGYPEFRKPSGKSNVKGDRGPEPIAYYGDLMARTFKSLDRIYPVSRTDRGFYDYIRAEVRYACAYALLSGLRDYYGERNDAADSMRIAQIYQDYLAKDGTEALIHDRYYDLARSYFQKLDYLKYGNRRSYRFSPEMIEDRIRNDYSLLLSPSFVEEYKAIQRDGALTKRLPDSVIIAKYFHNDKSEAAAYRAIMQKIYSEFSKESSDSMAYEINEGIPNTTLRFAANVQQLNYHFGDDDLPIASTYRLNIFKHYSQIPRMPWQLVDTTGRQRALTMGLAAIILRGDERRIAQVDHESEWQKVLARHRGKVVVAMMFSHYFQKNHVSMGLYMLQKLKEKYRGQDVVFVKCLQARHRSDKTRQLMEYLKIFSDKGELDNIVYVEQGVSIQAMMRESLDNCVIYNENGQPHHAIGAGEYYSRRRNLEPTLSGQIDTVLAKNGNYYLLAKAPKSAERDIYDYRGRSYENWTLFDSSGNYFSYMSKTPERPSEFNNYDTVFHQISMIGDSVWIEREMILHRRPPKRDGNFFSMAEYSQDYGDIRKGYIIEKDILAQRIRLYDKGRKLYRTFRPVFANGELMVLQLEQ